MIDIQSSRVVEPCGDRLNGPGAWRASATARAEDLRGAPFSAHERRWLSDFRAAGVPVTTVAWALDRSVEEIAVRFRVLGGGDTSLRPAPDRAAPAIGGHLARREPLPPAAPARPARTSPVTEAERVFRARLEVRDGLYLLDGRKVSLRELVLAAAADGTDIPYPGIRPLPESFHSGPSAVPCRPARLPRIAASR